MKSSSGSGASAIIAVVIIGAVALVIAKSASFIGISEAERSYIFNRREEMSIAVDGCLEEILRRWQINPDFTFSRSEFAISNINCSVVGNKNGDNWTITIVANNGAYNKKIGAIVNLAADKPAITDWEEIN